jgi:hypothetical protein
VVPLVGREREFGALQDMLEGSGERAVRCCCARPASRCATATMTSPPEQRRDLAARDLAGRRELLAIHGDAAAGAAGDPDRRGVRKGQSTDTPRGANWVAS